MRLVISESWICRIERGAFFAGSHLTKGEVAEIDNRRNGNV